jgi:GNAT superfamily N-acetyltransferase
MTITFHSESWDQYYNDPDREALWIEHYSEFVPAHEGKMAMGPDVAAYSALAASGALEIVVARKAGRMIGYCLVVVRRHIHYSSLCAFEDSYFVTKPERLGSVGTRLIKRALEVCKARGCVRAYWMTKEFNSIAKLFERLGMEKIDSVFAIWLED